MSTYSLRAYAEAISVAIASGAWTYLCLTIADAVVR